MLTSAGISAGSDMACWSVAQYCGEGVARATARHTSIPFPRLMSAEFELAAVALSGIV